MLGSGAAIVTGAPLTLVNSFYRGNADTGSADRVHEMPSGSADAIGSGVSNSISVLDRYSQNLLDTSKKLDWICIPFKNFLFPPDPIRLIKETGNSCAEGLGKRINDNLSGLSTKQDAHAGAVMSALDKVPEKGGLTGLLGNNHAVTTAGRSQAVALQESHNTNLTALTDTVQIGMNQSQTKVLGAINKSTKDIVVGLNEKSENLSAISENTANIVKLTEGINNNLGGFGKRFEKMNEDSTTLSNENTLSIIKSIKVLAKIFSGGGGSQTGTPTPLSRGTSASPSSSQMRVPVLTGKTAPMSDVGRGSALVRANSAPNLPRATDDLFGDLPSL